MASGSTATTNKNDQNSGYMMGHSASEAERLDRQHISFRHVVDERLLNPVLDRAIQSGQIRRVLDIGTGTGIWCYDAAAELQTMKVPGPVEFVGVDIAESPHWDRHRVQPAGPDDAFATISFQVTDLNDDAGMAKLAEQYGPFDLINSRMMISSVKSGQWPAYMRRMLSLLRPGGYVQLFEADLINSNTGRADDRTVAEAMIITHAVYSGSGLDPETAVRLAEWLYEVGFTRVRDIAYWCNPLVRQADGSLVRDDILYEWHSLAYKVVRPVFSKVQQSEKYAEFLEKLPPHAIDSLAGAKPESLLANEIEYDDFLTRHEAILTSDPRYKTSFRIVIAQRPE